MVGLWTVCSPTTSMQSNSLENWRVISRNFWATRVCDTHFCPLQRTPTDPGKTDGEEIKMEGLPDGYGLFNRSAVGGRQDKYLRGPFVIFWRELALTEF
jgi:hypothetical protein